MSLFSNLFPFMQLIAGINFGPSFVNSLLIRYFNGLNLLFKQLTDKFLENYNKLINEIEEEKILTNGLPEQEATKLIELTNKVKQKRIEKVAFYKQIYKGEIDAHSKRLSSKLEKEMDFMKQKIIFSFFMSGVFSISYLIFIPISNAFLSNLWNDSYIFIKVYIFYSIIIHLLFQIILNESKNNYFFIILSHIISSILLFITIIIAYSGYFETTIRYNFDFIELKYLIILLILSSLYSLIFYSFKYAIKANENLTSLKNKINHAKKNLEIIK